MQFRVWLGRGTKEGTWIEELRRGLGQVWLTPAVTHFLCVRSSGKLWSQAVLASDVPCQHPVPS